MLSIPGGVFISTLRHRDNNRILPLVAIKQNSRPPFSRHLVNMLSMIKEMSMGECGSPGLLQERLLRPSHS